MLVMLRPLTSGYCPGPRLGTFRLYIVCDTDTVSQNKAQEQSVNWVLTVSNMSMN